jgi:CRISPR-associated protein Csy1
VGRADVEAARRLLAAGDIAGARRAAEALLAGSAVAGEVAAAHLILAACCRHGRNGAAAVAHARAAVAATPTDAAAHYALAEQLDDEGNRAEAIECLQRSIALLPGLAPAHRYLGVLLAESGAHEAAMRSFERAIDLDPRHPRAWCNLGNARRALGRLADAEGAYREALALQPDYPLASYNLALVQRDLGRAGDAETTLRGILARQPATRPFSPALSALADLLRQRGALDESAELYGRAIGVAPADGIDAHLGLAQVLAERGDAEQARAVYAEAERRRPASLGAALGARLTLPMVYRDPGELAAERERYARGLAELERGLDRYTAHADSARVLDELRWTNFFLAYQGQDDRDLQSRYAAFAAAAVDRVEPSWRAPIAATSAAGRRIRVGFASAFLHFGTVGQYFHRWITELDPHRFEVFFFQLRAADDPVIAAIRARADHHLLFAGAEARPSRVAPAIRAAALDVLIYPELGMDTTSFALAALRLAPRQYAAWGHPVTTGHATVDGFFTCDVMEPPGGDAHYAEPLVRMPGIGTCYPRVTLPPPVPREALGLPSGVPLLLCPQSMFKIHPDNDDLVARVLAQSPTAMLVLFGERHPAITDRFMRRLAAAFERQGVSVRERTRVLPRVGHDDFLRVNLACDLMLDTLHWSGGNTSLDAIACGLPIVTLPGRFMRGRQSAGMLRLVDLPELIAAGEDDYVRIAVGLARDPERRESVRRTLRERADRIFEDRAPLAALHDFLQASAADRP